MTKEEEREDAPESSPEDTEEEDAEPEPEEEQDAEEADGETEEEGEAEDSEQNIDFEEELRALESQTESGEDEEPEGAPSGKTEEEKAGYRVRETIKRLKNQGKSDAEISRIVGFKVVTESPRRERTEDADPGYVTRDELDLRDAEREASRLARSEAEKKVIMHYVKHNKLSVEQAHLLANRGRIIRAGEELARARDTQRAPAGAAGRKAPRDEAPRFTKAEIEAFTRRGISYNPKTKRYEGRYTWYSIDAKSGERTSGTIPKQ